MKRQQVKVSVCVLLLIALFALVSGCDENATLIQGVWEYRGSSENIDSSLDGFDFNIEFGTNTMTISPVVSFETVSNISLTCNYTIQGSNIVTSGGALFCGQSYRFDVRGDVLLIEDFICHSSAGWCVGFEFVKRGKNKPLKTVANGANNLDGYDAWEYLTTEDDLIEHSSIKTLIFNFNSSAGTVKIDAELDLDLISYTLEDALECNYRANSGQVLFEVNDSDSNPYDDCKLLSEDIVFDYTINADVMHIDSICFESVCITGLTLMGINY